MYIVYYVSLLLYKGITYNSAIPLIHIYMVYIIHRCGIQRVYITHIGMLYYYETTIVEPRQNASYIHPKRSNIKICVVFK